MAKHSSGWNSISANAVSPRKGSARIVLGAASACAALLLAVPAASAAPKWRLGNEASFYQGKYGTAHTINIFYDATYLKLSRGRFRFKVTVPYEHVTGLPAGATVSGSGSVVNTGGKTTTSASGLGDIWLKGSYSLIPLTYKHPGFRIYSKIKIPTASHSAGLGTGKLDYEVGGSVTAVVMRNGYPFADLGYRVVGSPSNYALRNILTYDAGYSYLVNRKNVLTAMFSGNQSEQKGAAAPADLIFAWNYRVTRQSGIQLFVDKGLSNGSPDYGVGIGGHVSF